MRKKMIWASVLSMAMLLTACGNTADETSSKTDETQATTEAATEATTEAATEATTEASAANNGEGDELAQVQAAIDGYMKAASEANHKDLIKYYDIEMITYMETGKKPTEEEMIDLLKQSFFEGQNEGAEVGAPEAHPEYVQEVNDFMASDFLKEVEKEDGTVVPLNMAENYKIDGVYTFNYAAGGGGFSIDMDMTVLRINGEWKVDNAFTMAMSMASMMEGME